MKLLEMKSLNFHNDLYVGLSGWREGPEGGVVAYDTTQSLKQQGRKPSSKKVAGLPAGL